MKKNELLPEAGGAADGHRLPVLSKAGRESVVRQRLRRLLAPHGELRLVRALPAPEPGASIGRVLDDTCPAGSFFLHDRTLYDQGLRLDHVAVTSRGLVVVGPYRDLPYIESPVRRRPTTTANLACRAGRASALGAHGASRRSGVVRSTLGQSRALRWWLRRTPWADVPVYTAVLTAVSSSRGLFRAARPPLVIGGLWLAPSAPCPPGSPPVTPSTRPTALCLLISSPPSWPPLRRPAGQGGGCILSRSLYRQCWWGDPSRTSHEPRAGGPRPQEGAVDPTS